MGYFLRFLHPLGVYPVAFLKMALKYATSLYYRVCKVEVADDRLGAVYRENYVEYCALALGAVHFNASVHCFDFPGSVTMGRVKGYPP